MAKTNKKRKNSQKSDKDSKIMAITERSDARSDVANPLLTKQHAFLRTVEPRIVNHFFCESTVTADERAGVWTRQADVGEALVNQYAWATPDDRCFRILKEFSPLVEIGCGVNAYWCTWMTQTAQQKGTVLDIVGYDLSSRSGGKIKQTEGGKSRSTKKRNAKFQVNAGGPEVLSKNSGMLDRTLFLCYPDEDDHETESNSDPTSMGASCLEHYGGDHVIYVGELYPDTLSLDQAPWGRSASPEFQVRLATEFHCILRVPLSSNWLHVRDSISVWKRSKPCIIAFADDEDDDDEEPDEVQYKYIPPEETLIIEAAAPCAKHLLDPEQYAAMKKIAASTAVDEIDAEESKDEEKLPKKNKRMKSTKNKVLSMEGTDSPQNEKEETANDNNYVCPW
jgi:hypothetical protein